MRLRPWLIVCAAVFMLGRTAHADTLDDIKKRGELIVGMEAAYVPYESFKDGKIVGYDCDIAQKIADKLGVKVKFVDTDWAGIIPSLYTSKFDFIISAMAITKERTEKVAFSQPYADATNVLLVNAGQTAIKTAADISGKRVGAQLGSAQQALLQSVEAKLKAEGKPGYADFKLYAHYPEAYLDLTNKRLDAVANSITTLMVVMKEAPGRYAIIQGLQDFHAYTGIALRKSDTRLLTVVNDTLSEMKKDGSLGELQKKWFGSTMDTPSEIPATLP